MRTLLALLVLAACVPASWAQTNEEKPTNCTGDCYQSHNYVTRIGAAYSIDYSLVKRAKPTKPGELPKAKKDSFYSEFDVMDENGNHTNEKSPEGFNDYNDLLNAAIAKAKSTEPKHLAWAKTRAEELRKESTVRLGCSTGCDCNWGPFKYLHLSDFVIDAETLTGTKVVGGTTVEVYVNRANSGFVDYVRATRSAPNCKG